MIVPVTLIGTVVAPPEVGRTGRGVPVTKFRMSTSSKTIEAGQSLDVDVTTWAVSGFDKVGLYAAELAAVGQHVIVYGTASESRWERDGRERREFGVRADAIAPNPVTAVEPARLTLVGVVASDPEIEYEDGEPYVDLTVRTSRWRHMGKDKPRIEADVSYWPVVASGAQALAISEQFTRGSGVIVHGEARGVQRDRADGTGTYQDLEVWVDAIGPDLKRSEGRPA